MKVTILMAMSLNGMTCLEDRTESFLSRAGGELVEQIIRDTGSLIWGRRTDEVFQSHYPIEAKKSLHGIPKVVVSRNKNYKLADDYLLADSPKAAVAILEKKGITETVVVGGSKLNMAFLEAGLVDEIIIDIEPVIVGKGVPLFEPKMLEVRTELRSFELVNKGELLLKYRVVK